MVVAQARHETRLMLRHGEQVLLVLVLPIVLLTLFTAVPLLETGTSEQSAVGRVGFVAPGILALAVMSTAFTGQAIATAYERRYGVLKRLGSTPLPRWGLLAGKTLAVLAVEVVQVVVTCGVALALGWQPAGGWPAAAALLGAGTVAFSGLGLLLAGTLRAEATLAAANLAYVLMLVAGGVVFPLDRFPPAVQPLLELLPLAALAGGLRAVLQDGTALPWQAMATLAAWAVAGIAAAAATFRWE